LSLKEILRIGFADRGGLAAATGTGWSTGRQAGQHPAENRVERVKIIDFGLARAGDDASLTQSGVVAARRCTCRRNSDGLPVDFRSDLFSLAACVRDVYG